MGVTSFPEPPTSAPPEYEIGDVVTFNAENLEEDQTFQVQAELVFKTPHVYMFFQQGADYDLAAVKRSADVFENDTLPREHETFGSEWSPGIDGDPHIYILHAYNLGSSTAAYFAGESEYPREAVPTSNEHEMFYVNLDSMSGWVGTPYYDSVLSHEFQHMVHWTMDENEDTWMEEGLAELASMIVTHETSLSFAQSFLFTPAIQLNDWPENEDRGIYYGAAFLFCAYYYQRFGDEGVKALLAEKANGLAAMDNALVAINATDANGQPIRIADLFADWVATNWLNNGAYAYTLPDLKGLATANSTGNLSVSDLPVSTSAPQWGAAYLALPGPGTYHLSFNGSPTVSLVPVEKAHSGQYVWWGNRSNNSDLRMTHEFDLTGLTDATFSFWTWYYIEDLWDYGYIMVSTDNGATWTPLETTLTTTEDPHGNAFGNAYTGQSGDWVQQKVDLSPYAGQKILLRFEYMTDDAVLQPGMLIDDVSLPELGYSEDFENGDGGWVSEGWIRTNNILPQRFLVQLMQSGGNEPVTHLLGSEDAPQGEWDITVGSGAVISVTGLAPVTTEHAEFQYTLTQ